jgi:hypothetical protein
MKKLDELTQEAKPKDEDFEKYLFKKKKRKTLQNLHKRQTNFKGEHDDDTTRHRK